LGLAPRRGECQTWPVRAVKLGDDGGATRARAAVSFDRSWLGEESTRRCYRDWSRARSSAGERLLHTQEVVGSNPAAPTPKAAGGGYRGVERGTCECGWQVPHYAASVG
jgi:hypothetical protein